MSMTEALDCRDWEDREKGIEVEEFCSKFLEFNDSP